MSFLVNLFAIKNAVAEDADTLIEELLTEQKIVGVSNIEEAKLCPLFSEMDYQRLIEGLLIIEKILEILSIRINSSRGIPQFSIGNFFKKQLMIQLNLEPDLL